MERRRANVPKVPLSRMVEIRKTVREKRAHVVERNSRVEVRLKQTVWVRFAFRWVEAIDIVASDKHGTRVSV